MNDIKATQDDIRYAYRLLLGREPDPEGLETHRRHIYAENSTAPQVASLLMASAEFLGRTGTNASLKSPHGTLNSSQGTLDEIVFRGVKLYPWRGDQLIGDVVAAGHDYEPYVLPSFLKSIPVGGVVLDVGGNIGIFTLLAAGKVGEAGRVITIEPIARNVQSICAGVVGNGYHNVSILPVAASNAFGVIPIIRAANSSNGIVDPKASPHATDGFVPTQRLDVILSSLDRLDVIKIDIEGHEPIAWLGIEALVRKFRPVIFTEFSPVAIRNHSRVEPEGYLRALFEHARTLDVLHVDGRRVSCSTPEQVMAEWRDINQRLGRDGTHHLDLMIDAKRA